MRLPCRQLSLLMAAFIPIAIVNTAAGPQGYPPGTIRMTPRAQVDLQPVAVEVPPRFAPLLPDNLSLNLPPGFSARVFAAFDGLNRPRLMAFDANGVLHVANMNAAQIVALPDRDGDGFADEAVIAAEDFDLPHSLAFYDGALYVGDRTQILRLRDPDGDLVYQEREVLADSIPHSWMHAFRTLQIDADRERMFLSVGWPCDVCRRDDPELGVVLAFDLDGGGRRVFASGFRSILGMDLHPETGQLWATHNGHDREGIDAPPEWIDVIRDGGFYGNPLAYGNQVWIDFTIPQYRDEILPLTAQDSALVATMEPPVALIPAHTAPMGVHFYDHDHFPARYRHAAFIALHAGHAKLAPIEGYSVIALFSQPDGSNARYEDFLTGLQAGTEMEDVHGHPMGISTDAEGRLYVSSDGGYDSGHTYVLRIEHSPIVAEWADGLPDSVTSGSPLEVNGTVRVTRLDPDGGSPELTADFSTLGGPSSVALEPEGEGVWRLHAWTPVDVEGGLRTVAVTVRQPTAPNPHVVQLTRPLAVQPRTQGDDLVIFNERLAPGWDLLHKAFLSDDRPLNLSDRFAFKGEVSASFPVRSGEWTWALRFRPECPLDPMRFRALHFAVHTGSIDRAPWSDLNVYLGGTLIDLVDERYVDITSKEWQVIEVPLTAFGRPEPIREITFRGDSSGHLYLDDVRLVGALPPHEHR